MNTDVTDPQGVIAVNLQFLEQLAWKAWKDGFLDAGGHADSLSSVRASFNIWWGWQAASLEHGDWTP